MEASSGPNPDLRFPGQWFQSENGLHQNWMRDYDPTTGRYMQADPLGLVDGASVYGYALQNPGRYIDPTGQFIQFLPGLVLGCLAGGTGSVLGDITDAFLNEGMSREEVACQDPFWPFIRGCVVGAVLGVLSPINTVGGVVGNVGGGALTALSAAIGPDN